MMNRDEDVIAIKSNLKLFWLSIPPCELHHDTRIDIAEEQIKRWSKYLENAMCDFSVENTVVARL